MVKCSRKLLFKSPNSLGKYKFYSPVGNKHVNIVVNEVHFVGRHIFPAALCWVSGVDRDGARKRHRER